MTGTLSVRVEEFGAVPASLTENDSWVVWRYVARDGKSTKVPYSVITGRPASSTDPATWCSFDQAVDAFKNGNYAGIGFVFSPGCGLVGVDLDDCLVDGEPKRWAQPILEWFHDTYAEVSPSGNGVKIFARGAMPVGGKHQWTFDDGAVEIYDRGRYFTVTGCPFNGAPGQIQEHQADIERVLHVLAGNSDDAGGPPAAVSSERIKADLTTTTTIPGGRRHNFLMSMAAQFRTAGMEPGEILAAIEIINAQRCEPPKSRDELRKIVEWVGQRPPGKSRRSLPPAQPLAAATDEPLAATCAGNALWRDKLILTPSTGSVKAILANAAIALEHSPEFAGALALDEFAHTIEATRETPIGPAGIWSDDHDSRTAIWLQREGICVHTAVVAEAVRTVARRYRLHRVRDYLSGIEWDGVPRLRTWLRDYLGARSLAHNDGDGKDERFLKYLAEVGTRWMISAVARAFRPGCKVDTCLILEGPQGLLKSTTTRIMATRDEWHTDSLPDLQSKDAAMQLPGKWIIELSELDALSKTEASAVKAFLSRGVDRFRKPYGRTTEDVPRQCVFVGTTNRSSYLQDETGARRFWPVRCTSIDIDALQRDRDQLWAEAVAYFHAGQQWWITDPVAVEVAREQQADRYDTDPWQAKIGVEWLYNRKDRGVSIADVLEHCLDKKSGSWTDTDKRRVGRCMRHIGWDIRRPGPRLTSRERLFFPSPEWVVAARAEIECPWSSMSTTRDADTGND